jgi:hypothetical protein
VARAKIPARPVKVLCQQCQKDFTFRLDPLRDSAAPAKPGPQATPQSATVPGDGPPTRRQLASIGDLFSRTWTVFKRRILTLVGINLLAAVLAVAAYFLFGSGLDLLRRTMSDNPVVVILVVLTIVGFALLVVTAIGAGMTCAIVDEDLGVSQALVYGIQNFLPFLWVFSLLGFILFGGYLAFFIPGLLFTVWFAFAQFILASENVRGMDALMKSREYVRGHGWGICGRILLLGVLGTLISAIPIIGLLFSLVLGPFTLIYYHEIFRDLHEIKGNISYTGSRGAKAKWLLAGAAGYLVIPLLGLLLLGPTLLQGLDLLRSQAGFNAVWTPSSSQSPATNTRSADLGRLSLNQAGFAPREDITVEFVAPAGLPSDAWVGIIPSHVSHGDESHNDQYDLSYQYLNTRSRGSLKFTAPSEPGSYDLRMHDTDSGGREIASVSFQVTALDSGAAVVSAPPDNGPHRLELERASYAPGEPITLRFSGIRQPASQDWVSLYKVGADNQNYGEYYYLQRQANGELHFTAPQQAGNYEFRLFLNWPDGGYETVARSQPFTVGQNGSAAVPAVAPEPLPAAVSSGIGQEPEQSPTTIHVPLAGDNPEQVMVYVYAINYLGSVRLNGREIYPIEGERDMNYNYTSNATLERGRNVFELDYRALPDPWMTRIQLKVYRYDWNTSQETVLGNWTYEDPGSKRSIEVVLGD